MRFDPKHCKNTCFAFKETKPGEWDCHVLKEIKNCDGCKFYKTEQQLAEQQKRCAERVKTILGSPGSEQKC